jgi:hypothetical protein
VLAALLILAWPGEPRSAEINLHRRYPVIEAENQVWVGTPHGLYRYNPDDDSFKRASPSRNGVAPAVRQLHYGDEWLWCILDHGLAALHIRLNEWLFFDVTSGLPSNAVNGLALQDDTVWIATDSGVARYDLLIEEWEAFGDAHGLSGRPASDIVVRDGRIWMLTDRGLSEYDPQYERWRHHAIGAEGAPIPDRMFLLGDEVWLAGEAGLVRFDPELLSRHPHLQPYLRRDSLLEVVVEEDRIWAITRLGLYVYEAGTEVWREFEGNAYLRTSRLADGTVDPRSVWVLTDHSVLAWDRSERNWEILDYASGLTASSYESVYVNGGLAILLNPEHIDHRRSQQDPWVSYATVSRKGGRERSWGQIARDLFDNEAGGSIPLGNATWSWQGSRAAVIHEHRQFFTPSGGGDPHRIWGERLDVKNRLTFGEERSLSGFYNNADYSETMYGVQYKARGDEVVRELGWGDFRREQGEVPFGEPASIFGGNVWLQAGPKTPRFKRSRFGLKAMAGELRSRKTYEFYEGAADTSSVVLRDLDYSRNEFYAIPDLISAHDPPEGIRIYVDDLVAGNNTARTLARHTVAGVTGDYDLWREGEDFQFYSKANVIRFYRPVMSGWTLVAAYTSKEGPGESVLQHGGIVSTARRNIYHLGGAGIIPFTFDLAITDTSDTSVPIARFGIDDDGDGRADPEWVDFSNGLLILPGASPFPDSVYDPAHPRSHYRLVARYQTERSLIQLKQRHLVRGSEVLRLDGLAAASGRDYVLDYTNGTLVFVREEAVSTDTRIEIEYEYYAGEDAERVRAATMSWSPSDRFTVQGDWLQFTAEDSAHPGTEGVRDLLSLHGEFRETLGAFDLRITPGLAYNPRTGSLAGSDVEAWLSSPRLRVRSYHRSYTQDYQNLYRPQRVVGDVRSAAGLSSSLDLRDDLRFTGEWQRSRGSAASHGVTPTDRAAGLGLLFHRARFPSLRLDLQNTETRGGSGTSRKTLLQTRFVYQLPKSWCRKLSLRRLKAEALLRVGRRSGSKTSGRQAFHLGHLRLNTTIREQVQGTLIYRQSDLDDAPTGGRRRPLLRSERLLVDLVHEKWRPMQLNVRAENRVSQYFHSGSATREAGLLQYAQLNLRMSPGQVWSRLAPFHFDLDLTQSLTGSGNTDEEMGSRVWRLFSLDRRRLQDAQVGRTVALRNELRPGTRWFLHSLIERSRQELAAASAFVNRYWRWTEKLDMKLGYRTRLSLQYRQVHRARSGQRSDWTIEPSAWIERRWTAGLQNTLYLRYRRLQEDDRDVREGLHDWEARTDLIWRRQGFLRIRRLEARQSLSAAHRRGSGTSDETTYQFGSSTALDLYPLHSMILRLRLDLGRYVDWVYPQNDLTDLTFSLRLLFRF